MMPVDPDQMARVAWTNGSLDANEVLVDELELLDAVRRPELPQGLELGERGGLVRSAGRDDQLPAPDVRHAPCLAELVQQTTSTHAQLCLERAGRIVDARVKHAAVVRAGLDPQTRVTFEEAHGPPGVRDLGRARQPHHASPDDDAIDVGHTVRIAAVSRSAS